MAGSQPHAAFAALVHGVKNKWNYLCRTISECSSFLQPIEESLHQKFIPAITGRPPCSQDFRALLALPVKHGGLGLIDPTSSADHEYDVSKEITSTLVQSMKRQDTAFRDDPTDPNPSNKEIAKKKKERQQNEFTRIYGSLDRSVQRLVDCASEPGASAWLSALPIEEHGFCLNKSSFRDALSLRYGWQLPNVSSMCACGMSFSIDHAMMCHKGGLPTLRHNEVRDLTATLLAKSCTGVSVEPPLQVLDDEEFNLLSANREDEARLDIRVSDFWMRGKEAFFDVRVFYPNAPSYRQKELSAIYKLHENEKKRCYGERVRDVERA